jgi:hypothetical protein
MKVNSIVLCTSSCKITGAGKGKTFIDGTGITEALSNGVIQVQGTLTQIADVTASPSEFDGDLTFASAPALAANQVGLIWNPTASSYSGHRTAYYAGEFFHVQSVSGSTATLTSQLYSGYTAANVDIYTLDGVAASISDLTITAPNTSTYAIRLELCVKSKLSNVETLGGTSATMSLARCFDVAVTDCSAVFLDTTGTGNDYGLVIGNSQNIRVSNGYFVGRRHGVAMGGGADVGSVVCRDVIVDGCTVTSFTNTSAFNTHGNCEHIIVSNNTINGGAGLSGDKTQFIGNRVFGTGATAAFVLNELKGIDWLVADNYFMSNGGNASDRGWGLDIGGNSTVLTTSTTEPGVLRFINNTWVDKAATKTATTFARIRNRGATIDLNVEFCGNSIRATDTDGGLMQVDTVSGSSWKNVTFSDNTFYNGAIQSSNSENVFIYNNSLINASTNAHHGINIVIDVNNGYAHIIGNIIKGAASNGMNLNAVGTTGTAIYCKDNVVTGSAGTYDILMQNFPTMYCLNNITGIAIRMQTATDGFAFGNNIAINASALTNFTELGYDASANLIMPSLPTSTPGGADRVWNNSNVLNIT